MPQGKRTKNTYANGQPLVTPGNYRARLWQLPTRLREEALRMMRERGLDGDDEWEAVEAVVMQIGVKHRRPVDLPPSTDFRWLYGG